VNIFQRVLAAASKIAVPYRAWRSNLSYLP